MTYFTTVVCHVRIKLFDLFYYSSETKLKLKLSYFEVNSFYKHVFTLLRGGLMFQQSLMNQLVDILHALFANLQIKQVGKKEETKRVIVSEVVQRGVQQVLCACPGSPCFLYLLSYGKTHANIQRGVSTSIEMNLLCGLKIHVWIKWNLILNSKFVTSYDRYVPNHSNMSGALCPQMLDACLHKTLIDRSQVCIHEKQQDWKSRIDFNKTKSVTWKLSVT